MGLTVTDGPGSGSDGVRVPRWAIVVGAIAIVVLAGAVGALAFSGGSDSNSTSVSAGATTSSSSISAPVGAGGSGSSGGAPTKPGTSAATSPTPQPPPVFTQLYTDHNTVVCSAHGDTPELTVFWNTKNATLVSVSGLEEPANGSLSLKNYACTQNSVPITAAVRAARPSRSIDRLASHEARRHTLHRVANHIPCNGEGA